jgi:hypothetical protein
LLRELTEILPATPLEKSRLQTFRQSSAGKAVCGKKLEGTFERRRSALHVPRQAPLSTSHVSVLLPGLLSSSQVPCYCQFRLHSPSAAFLVYHLCLVLSMDRRFAALTTALQPLDASTSVRHYEISFSWPKHMFSFSTPLYQASLAQLVERGTSNAEVTGSTPLGGSSLIAWL